MRGNCCNRVCSFTALASGLIGATGGWSWSGAARTTTEQTASTPRMKRIRTHRPIMTEAPLSGIAAVSAPRARRGSSHRNSFVIRSRPSPCTAGVTARLDAVTVDLGDDVAVPGQERLGRAHLGADRELAGRQTVGAVFLVLCRGPIGFRATRAVGAFVHLAARTEVADLGILRRAERAGVEAIAAADAEVLGVQHHGIGGGVEAVYRAHGPPKRVGAMPAGPRDRALGPPAVTSGDGTAAGAGPPQLGFL